MIVLSRRGGLRLKVVDKGKVKVNLEKYDENLCYRLGVGLEDAYDRVKWRGLGHGKKSVTPWKRGRC